MKEACIKSQDFLNTVFNGAGFNLRATAAEAVDGCLLNIDGADTSLLLSEGGELLEALQHLVNQAFSRELERGERIVCDAECQRACTRYGRCFHLWPNEFKRASCDSPLACGRR
jgi:predicted RNA-binding protein Jag